MANTPSKSPKILTEADLVGFAKSTNACWVQDIYRSRVVWANDAAVNALDAASDLELYARDISPLSVASRTRLWTYLTRVRDGGQVVTQWTTHTSVKPITLLATVSAFQMADERITLFFDCKIIDELTCPEALRMIEAARHSSAFFAMFDLEGRLLEQNAASIREFGDRQQFHEQSNADVFLQLFLDRAEGNRIRKSLIEAGESRTRVQLLTQLGARWHVFMGRVIPDPVTGKKVLHTEAFDITDQVEAENVAQESQQLLQRLADEYPNPVAYVTRDKVYKFVNRTFCNWLDKKPQDVLGHTLGEISGAQAEAMNEMHWPMVMRGARASYERHAVYNDKPPRWIQVDIVPFIQTAASNNTDAQMQQTTQTNAVEGGFIFAYDIHALKLAQQHVKTVDKELRELADNMPVAIAKLDKEDRFTFVNAGFAHPYEMRPEAMLGLHIDDISGPVEFNITLDARRRAINGETVHLRLNPKMHGNPTERYLDLTVAPSLDEAGKINGSISIFQDVTARVEAKAALDNERNKLASHLDNTPLGVITLDNNLRIVQWIGRAKTIFAWREEEVLGKTLDELRIFDEQAHGLFSARMQLLLHGGSRFTAQFRNTKRDGETIHAEWYGSVLRDRDEKVDSYLMLVQDISARIAAESHLQFVSNHDLLTGLANRAQFQQRLAATIARAHRNKQRLAVVLLDLDRFKYVNDSLGHQTGDALLQLVAVRLKNSVRETDFLARAGGDEFMLLFELGDNTEMIQRRIDIIAAEFKLPFRLTNQEIFVTTSIGVAIYPDDAVNDIEIIKNADWALFRAKDNGRNNVQFFSHTAASDRPQRLSTESAMRHAIEKNEFELHYQPKININSQRLTGAEALIRWRHPVRGLVPPDAFIPFAEESGLIVDIGRWVITETCRQLAKWREEGFESTQIAVNLSAVQLKRTTLADEILAELARFNLPGNALMVEITETSVVTDPVVAHATLATLRSNGVHAAIDDFGKGFSSLIQLKRLPIDALKIDGSFIRDLVTDRDDAAIVQAIIGLAHNLNLHVVAECVETEEQLSLLARAGCDEAQGYHLARPLPADLFAEAFLKPKPAAG